ncbi:MAG: hypothetical protein M3Q33_09275 [Acidobacteriota bacterium]|nr:hypothetical protein [Acidobacteriota bacterium]
MKLQNTIVYLGLIFILLVTLGFKCGSSDDEQIGGNARRQFVDTSSNKSTIGDKIDLTDNWYYTELIDSDGKVSKMANRVSFL